MTCVRKLPLSVSAEIASSAVARTAQQLRVDPPRAPTTRYQGSKFKLLDWIWRHVEPIGAGSALDVFGGSACVSHLFKQKGLAVTYNDGLRFNYLIGLALIENGRTCLSDDAIESVMLRHPDRRYDDLISRTFGDIYFTDEENVWLDVCCQNIRSLSDPREQALAYHALFQSAIAKRPYNLFHRRNLYMRTARVTRTFGNKATWDRPFPDHFRAFARRVNAAVFDNNQPCRALHCDALALEASAELVYIDPPYISARGVGVDYRDFYHFLEGLADYGDWEGRIDWNSRHLRLIPERSPFSDPRRVHGALQQLFERHARSTIIMSYRSDGIPSVDELCTMLRRLKPNVTCHEYGRYHYALSTNRRSSEVLLIAQD